MNAKSNAARVAVQAEPCPDFAAKQLFGLHDTHAQVMAAAETAARQHSHVIGYSSPRVEVCQ